MTLEMESPRKGSVERKFMMYLKWDKSWSNAGNWAKVEPNLNRIEPRTPMFEVVSGEHFNLGLYNKKDEDA